MPKFDPRKDYYGELNISRQASSEEIERAYRAEARKRHPDGGGSEEAMKLLNEAHDVLSDLEARKAYDEERRATSPTASPLRPPTYDPYAASKAGTLKVPVSNADYSGLLVSALGCIGVGLMLLLLVELQWVFFLWPLRILAIGALLAGVYMGHGAMKMRQKLKAAKAGRFQIFAQEATFWSLALAGFGGLMFALYSA